MVFESINMKDLLRTGRSFVLNYEQGRRFFDLALFRLIPPNEIGVVAENGSEDWASTCLSQPITKVEEIFRANFEFGFLQLKKGANFSNVWIGAAAEKSEWVRWLTTQGYWPYDKKAYAVALLAQLDHLEVYLLQKDIESALNVISRLHILLEQSEMLDRFIEAVTQSRTEVAKLLGRRKHSEDPRQEEKKFVFECWRQWQSKPSQYPSKAAFARSMIEKCEHLVSTKKIEDWTRSWDKGEIP